MKKLLRGIVDFHKNTRDEYRERFSQLALRQSPDALLVACCDSRVVPNVFASSNPGDVFVVRNIGNIIPPYVQGRSGDASVSAALEYSVHILGVSDIVICGHSDCGAMDALLKHKDDPGTFHAWLEFAESSYNRFHAKTDQICSGLSPSNQLSQVHVLQQLEHICSYPFIMERVQRKKLRVHGWWFDLKTADVYYYKSSINKFVVIDEQEALGIISSLDK